MAIRIPSNSQKHFIEAGLVPPGCTNLEIHIPVSGGMVLRYDVFMTRDQLERLGVAFQQMALEVDALNVAAK